LRIDITPGESLAQIGDCAKKNLPRAKENALNEKEKNASGGCESQFSQRMGKKRVRPLLQKGNTLFQRGFLNGDEGLCWSPRGRDDKSGSRPRNRGGKKKGVSKKKKAYS